jgi:hypothetical protein
MALADYVLCSSCCGKALYDGYCDIRDREDIKLKVLCESCSKIYDLQIVEIPIVLGDDEAEGESR